MLGYVLGVGAAAVTGGETTEVLVVPAVLLGAYRALTVSLRPEPDVLVVTNLWWTHEVPWRSIWQFGVVPGSRTAYDRRSIERRGRRLPLDALPAWPSADPGFARLLRWCTEHGNPMRSDDAWLVHDPPPP